MNWSVPDEAAREWYHRNMPGGMPRDWIDDAAASGLSTRLHVAATAALLHVSGNLHVNAAGNGCTYRTCVLCRRIP